MTAIKTIQLPLITDIQTIDTSKLDRMFDEFKIVYDETAKRMPSLPKYTIKRSKGDPYYYWVKEFRDRPDVDLPAKTTQEAVGKAREAYVSMHSNKNYDGIPHGGGNVVRFHNQQIKFKKIGDYYFISLPTRAGRGTRVLIPIRQSKYSYNILGEVSNGKKCGASELVRHNGSYWFNLTVKWDVQMQEHGTPIGIDFGMRNIAVACALDNGHPNIKLWSGKEAYHRRKRYHELLDDYKRNGHITKVKNKKKRHRDYMETKNHQVSREIIKFASQFDSPYIILEDLHQFRKPADWSFSELRTFVEYKALHAGIDVVTVDAKYTSQRCNKCGHTHKQNRPGNGIIFSCCDCGYTVNADVNAAINIATC